MLKNTIAKEKAFRDNYLLLNEEQAEAVDSTDGPLLVLAGPGTGKTQLLSVRAANIVSSRGIEPDNLLILTFTNASTKAMRERLAMIMGDAGYRVDVETFHSFANSIVLESERAIDFVEEKIEITNVEKVRAIEYILDNVEGVEALRPFGNPYIHRREIEARISDLKNEGILPEEFEKQIQELDPDGINLKDKHIPRLRALSVIYREYEALKDSKSEILFDERGRIDYDDMIIVALDALRKDEKLKKELRSQYKYIMVDEYQDTNGAQLELLFSILDKKCPNICCVGDDDQAIYRFQGATLSNFRVLEKKLPDLKKISLKNNYRSTDQIINTCSKISGQIPKEERMEEKDLVSKKDIFPTSVNLAEFLTEEEELSYLVNKIKEISALMSSDENLPPEVRERPLNNIAILLRTRRDIQKVVDILLRSGIPYATDGAEDIRREKRVRQMLDVLDLADIDTSGQEDKDLPLYKVLTSDYLGVSQADIMKLIEYTGREKRLARKKGRKPREVDKKGLFTVFLDFFDHFRENEQEEVLPPEIEESEKLPVNDLINFENANALHRACWAINRMLENSASRPVHDILMQYIDDVSLYKFILKKYSKDKTLRVRELRGLVSFVNMVKTSDLSDPGLTLSKFSEELKLRKIHDLPIRGELATLNQDGVKVLTAHKAKGLEFYAVFVPFCLEKKSWPHQGKPDVVPLPPGIYKSKERVEEKKKLKLLSFYDELRLFYVASSRAKAHLIYTATPQGKRVTSSFLSGFDIKEDKIFYETEEEFLVDYLKRTDTKDALLPTPRILKEMVSTLSLNPTSLNTYIRCPRKFLYNVVLRLPAGKNQHLVFGNCAHNALEAVYSRYMKTSVFPEYSFFRDAFRKHLNYEGVASQVKTWCLARLKKLETWYEVESSQPVMPLELEKKLEVTLSGGIVFRGAFDKIESAGDKKIKVIDYKTGKPYRHLKDMASCRDLSSGDCDDYLRQLVAYKLLYDRACSKKNDKTVSVGVLQFLEPAGRTVKKYGICKGEYVKKEVPVSYEKTRQLSTVIAGVWSDIQDLKFERVPEEDKKAKCDRCDYSSLCWSA